MTFIGLESVMTYILSIYLKSDICPLCCYLIDSFMGILFHDVMEGSLIGLCFVILEILNSF